MSRSGRLLVAVAIVAIVGLAAAGGVFKDFSSFEFYDDEGYMMLSLRHVLDGNRLYGDVRVPYGPAYYLEKWIVHGALAVPLTHAAVRVTTATLRVSAAGLAGVAAARIAGSVPLGALTFLVVHRDFMLL